MGAEAESQGAVGLLIDRSLYRQPAIAAACLIDRHRAAVCASSVSPYLQDLSALKVRFPEHCLEVGVLDAQLHPQYSPGNEASLEKFNIAIISLYESLPDLTPERCFNLQRKLGAENLAGFPGDMQEFALPVVLQTLTNGGKSGTLVIADERGTEQAGIFMQSGAIRQAWYQNLRGQKAVYQLFCHKFAGKFRFEPGSEPPWQEQQQIEISTAAILSEGATRVSQLAVLSQVLQASVNHVQISRQEPDLSALAAEFIRSIQLLWHNLDGRLPLCRLWQVADLDDLEIYRAISVLVQSGQVQLFAPQSEPLSSLKPFQLHTQPSAPLTKLSALLPDPYSERVVEAKATVSAIIWPFDAVHMTYSAPVKLYPGCPLLINGALAAIHCGVLVDGTNELRPALVWATAIAEACGTVAAQHQPQPNPMLLMADPASMYLDAANQAFLSRQWQAAEENYRKAVQAAQKQPGDPFLPEALRRLASFCLDKPDLAQAYLLAKQALDLDQQMFGDASLAVAEDLYIMGESQRLQGRFQAAIPLLKDATLIRERDLGPLHQQVGSLLAKTIIAQLEADDQNNLAELHKRAGAYYNARTPDGGWLRFLQIEELLDQYMKDGRRAEAERICKQEHDFMKTLFGPRDPDMIAIVQKASQLVAPAGAAKDLSGIKTTGGMSRWATKKKEDSLTEDEYFVKATQCEVRGELAEAERYLKEGIAELERRLGMRHPKAKQAFLRYAALLRKMKRNAEAAFIEAKLKGEGSNNDSKDILDGSIMRRFLDMF